MPIIFITGQGDIPMTVQAMKAGAIEFLTKPYKGECFCNLSRVPSRGAKLYSAAKKKFKS